MKKTGKKSQAVLTATVLLAVACTHANREVRNNPHTIREQPSSSNLEPLCVLEHGLLRDVIVEIVPDNGDTLVDGRRFSDVFPTNSPPYATGALWFIRNGPLRFKRRLYHGGNHPPQVIASNLLQNVGSYEGVPLFAEAGDSIPEIIYIPLRPGCVFQSYIGIQLGPADP